MHETSHSSNTQKLRKPRKNRLPAKTVRAECRRTGLAPAPAASSRPRAAHLHTMALICKTRGVQRRGKAAAGIADAHNAWKLRGPLTHARHLRRGGVKDPAGELFRMIAAPRRIVNRPALCLPATGARTTEPCVRAGSGATLPPRVCRPRTRVPRVSEPTGLSPTPVYV